MKTTTATFVLAGLLLPGLCAFGQESEPPKERKGPGDEGRPHKPFAELWAKADADGDGKLSLEEFGALPRIQNLPEEKREHIFKRLDKDDDGFLSREELQRIRGGRGHGGHPKFRLWMLDTDKSGGVSFEEFQAGEMFKKLPLERQEKIFERLDTDGDGQLSPKDRPEPHFRRGEGRRGGPGHGDPRRMVRMLDKDDDGSVSFEEFSKAPFHKDLGEDELEDRFEKLDRNGDKKLDAGDFPEPGEGPPPAPGKPPVDEEP